MNVVAVKLFVLVRSEAKSPGYDTQRKYCMSTDCTEEWTFSDGYKRHLFTQTVRLTNVSMRRETP